MEMKDKDLLWTLIWPERVGDPTLPRHPKIITEAFFLR